MSIMATIRWCPIFPKWDIYQPLIQHWKDPANWKLPPEHKAIPTRALGTSWHSFCWIAILFKDLPIAASFSVDLQVVHSPHSFKKKKKVWEEDLPHLWETPGRNRCSDQMAVQVGFKIAIGNWGFKTENPPFSSKIFAQEQTHVQLIS